ncbi:A-kinase anchor protein 12 isoform X2 [Tamandua tetradactyla]|uniref:A-kinase anchor protein 12 isoform X2 n=1 Tax=Tamandua tetradactyla TaxID=48850 RepID=UPI004054627E
MPWWSNLCLGQRDSEDVSEKDSEKEMAASTAVVQDITKDEEEETPEIIEQIPSTENNLEELEQPTESQSNDVGFKKVFKFVGFKFTVKKDKSEKSDTVQLLTVKKDEAEGAGGSNGAGDHQDTSLEIGEVVCKENELTQSIEKTEETVKSEQSDREISLKAESGQATEGKDEGEEIREKEPSKSPESPASPLTSETPSSFKKFFTQGWAGWRKKTSFRKPKEDELEASEMKKEQEPQKGDAEENGKTEATSETLTVSEQPHPPEATESVSVARLSAEYEKVEPPSEDQVNDLQGSSEEKSAPLATEVFDEKVEIVADVHVSTVEEETEPKAEVEAVESMPPETSVDTNAELQEAEPTEGLVKTKEVCVPGEDHTQLIELSPDEKISLKHPEGIVSEAEMLSSQERIKIQGSPLKKLFTSTGLKKLSGKKQKGKRGGDEESGEQNHIPADSPDSDEHKGESSASSPEEPEEITCLEKSIADVPQDGDVEEGTTSDGDKKREGVTPWASFKKMVTPKKRVRRPSESDKEDELDKAKSATLSSTESAASEMQEEIKGTGEEQKPEEPKRKVDTSVSWEALICVGSSKKRARKASSSDEEGGPKPMGGDGHKADEAGKDQEMGSDHNAQEPDPGQGSSSPEQVGSPSEGEGVSTWESFKRLVTPRKKPKSKFEEKNEDSVTGSGIEHSASDVEPGKEESWVSIKKFIPGRRKKRTDGKQEQASSEDVGSAEANEDESDVPAVVPLSEYDAVEQEKIEAQQAQKREEKSELKGAVYVSEELSKSLVHPVTVAVIDGVRAVSSTEERSPSWISTSVVEPLEQAEDAAQPSTGELVEREVIAEETPVDAHALLEHRDTSDDTVVSEVRLTSEAVMAADITEPLCAEEVTEASGAEETTEMVSAVSQLTDSPDTTEEATPVQEVEGGIPDLEDLGRRTQEVLQAAADKVKDESHFIASAPEDAIGALQKENLEMPEKVEGTEEDSQMLEMKKEMGGVLKAHVEETRTEEFKQEKIIEQTTPESFEKVPQVTESVESSDLRTTSQAEVESQITVEQTVTLDSVETKGSTPVSDFEVLKPTQQDKIVEICGDKEIDSGIQSQFTEAEVVPVEKEMPPVSSNFQSQEENKEQSKTEVELTDKEVSVETDKEVSVETVHSLLKTEVIQEAGQFADEETKNILFTEGFEVSTDPKIAFGQKKITEVTLKDEVTEEAEFRKNVSHSGNTELQSPTTSLSTPAEKEMVVQVEREKTEPQPAQVREEKHEQKLAVTVSEEVSKCLVQTVNVTVIDGEKEVTSFEESSPSWLVQEEVVSRETQVQSSEASLTLTAAAVEEKVLGETVKVIEIVAETLESADAHLVPEEKSEKDEDFPSSSGVDAVPVGIESQAESVPVKLSATTEKDLHSDLKGEQTTSQKWKLDGDEKQMVCQEVKATATKEGDLKAENKILEIETESNKLVQNIIQTAVDQLVSTEEAATERFISDLETQTHPTKADGQEAGQKTMKEVSELQASAQDETQTITAKEESELPTVGQAQPGFSKDGREASEKMTIEAESSSEHVSEEQLEEETSEEKTDAIETTSMPENGVSTTVGENIEKSPFEPKEDEQDDTVDYPEHQNSTLEDTAASGGLTKESPGTDGLKEKEDAQGVEFQESNEPEKEIKIQGQEEIHKQERESAKSELHES